MSTSFIVVDRTIAAFGTVAPSTHNFCGAAESLSYVPEFTFGTSATTLFSQVNGAKQYKMLHRFTAKTIKLGAFIVVFLNIILFTCSTSIVFFFIPAEEVITMGSTLLKF